MRANRATTAAMPSPTFTHATTCTVPKSSPLLSSSFTPFYPRSQQHLYHPHLGYVGPHDGGCQVSVPQSDDIDASQSHFSSWSHVRDSKYYDPQYYASSGTDPYEVSWLPNGGTAWDGGAWQQWGDAVEYGYAEDDTGDSANLFSDSLSYYAESPTLEQDIPVCASSNTTSIPVLLPIKFLNRHVNEGLVADHETSSSITGSTAMANVFPGVIMPEQASSASKKLKESSLLNFRDLKEKAASGNRPGPAKGETKEAANASAGSKLSMNPPSSQVSVQTSPGFGGQASDFKMTSDSVENVQAEKDSNMLLKDAYNVSKQLGPAVAIDTKLSISSGISNLRSFTLSDISQKEVQTMKNVSDHTSMQSSNDLCQSMALPKLVTSQALEQVNDYENSHQDKTDSSFIQPQDIGLCSNGPRLLVECLHNLSKVLLCNQNKASILNASDCLILENTICMLSHRLFQCSTLEANSCQDSNCQQELKNKSDSMKGIVEPASLQKASNQFASMNHFLSFKRNFEHELSQNAPKLSAISSTGGENQNSDLLNHLPVSQKELRVLRGEVQKLQEEIGYERAESNATVSIYKDLWSEAQEALKVSRSELKEIRTELAGLKQELTNLKLSGGANRECEITDGDNKTISKQETSNFATSSSQGVTAVSDLSRVSTEERNNSNSVSLKKDSEVQTGYFDPGILLNCRNTWTSLAKFEKAELKQSYRATASKQSSKSCELITSKSSSNHMIAAPVNLENDVARRLSLLLSRQNLDLNKTCTENCIEWPSVSPTILEPSSNVRKEDEVMRPDKDYLVWSESSCLVNHNNGSGCSLFNLCQRRHVSEEEEEEDDLYDLMETEPNDGGMDAAVSKEGICHEDEIEIICFKPGITDSNFTCLKGEPEWEDVVVNALDDHRSAKEVLA